MVAFDVRCWHGSWGGAVDRRMCVLVYYNNPKTPEEAAATQKQIIGNGVDYGAVGCQCQRTSETPAMDRANAGSWLLTRSNTRLGFSVLSSMETRPTG